MAKNKSCFFVLIFVSVILSCSYLCGYFNCVYADDNPKTLEKRDLDFLEKITFYNNDKENLIGTDPEGEEINPGDAYEFMKGHRLVSTEKGEVKAGYAHVGQFNGRDISVRITFHDFVRKPEESFGERDGRSICIPKSFRDSFHYDGDSLIQNVVFYYSDDKSETPIDMTDAFIVINGLNVDEYAGIAPDHRVYLAEHSQLEEKTEKGFICFGNGPQADSDTDIDEEENRKFSLGETPYDDKIDNPLYYICSAMFTLKGTENEIYIEDTRKKGGYGFAWCLDLATFDIRYNIKTTVSNGNITDCISDIIYNSDRTITYTPSENYVLDSINVDGTPIDITTAPSEYTFKNITRDHEISVVYKLPYKKILTEVVNGNITKSDENVLFGTDKDISYTPDDGFILDSILVDGKPAPTDKNRDHYLFENVKEDHQIKVIYTKPDTPVKKVLDKNREFLNGKSASAGDILTYEISYKNNFGRKADIQISDTIPAFTEFVSASGNGRLEKDKVVWSIQAEPMEEGTVSMNVRVKPQARGNNISNYAIETIDGINLMSNTVNNPVQGDPVKKVKDINGREINESFVEKDQEIVYSITVKNAASEDKDLRIKDDIPEGMAFINADNGGTLEKNTVSWNTVIKGGEEKQVSFRVRVSEEGKTFINRAEVLLDGIEMLTNKTENWSLLSPKKEVKQKGVSVDGRDITSGDTITYYITVKNTLPGSADIRVEDKIPDHLETVNMDNGAKTEKGVIIWDLKELASGETKTVSFSAKVKGDADPHKVRNKAYILIGDKKLPSNEVSINIPAVRKIEVMGKILKPFEKQEQLYDSGVLGERKLPTGDDSDILALVLVALCAFAGIITVRIKNV